MPYRVSEDEFGDLVERALDEVPPQFAELLEEVLIQAVNAPTLKQRRALGTRRGGLLLGLYVGRPRTERHVTDDGHLPDTIWIFQDNLQAISRSRADLIAQVRKTVLHEIGHHFGLDEQQLDDLGYG